MCAVCQCNFYYFLVAVLPLSNWTIISLIFCDMNGKMKIVISKRYTIQLMVMVDIQIIKVNGRSTWGMHGRQYEKSGFLRDALFHKPGHFSGRN